MSHITTKLVARHFAWKKRDPMAQARGKANKFQKEVNETCIFETSRVSLKMTSETISRGVKYKPFLLAPQKQNTLRYNY